MENAIKYLRIPILNTAVIIAAILALLPPSSYSANNDRPTGPKADIFKPVKEKLLKRGADTAFVEAMINDKKTKFDVKYIKINVTGNLNKTDYSHNHAPKSVKKTSDFLHENKQSLELCEKEYDVPSEVIAAIIFVETRCGAYLGKNHVPSVFFSAALAGAPKYIKINKLELRKKFKGDKKELPALDRKLEERSKRKAEWALNEILALGEIYKRAPSVVHSLKGSWAGAFGMSQFLPSSFVNWAVDGNGDGKTDLFDTDDAIHSAANYLKENGWGKTEKQQRAAIYHYNHSADYVDATLKLAEIIKSKTKKSPASFKTPLSRQINVTQR